MRTGFLAACIVLCAWTMGSRVGAEVQIAKRILLVTNDDALQQMSALAETLTVYFQDLNAEVLLEVVEYSPQEAFQQVATVKSLVRSKGAFSAVWVSRSEGKIFLFNADDLTENIFLQTFEGSEDGWEVECDTIAALVRSALMSWLTVAPESAVPKETDEVPLPKKRPDPPHPKPHVMIHRAVAQSSDVPLRFTIGAGYNPKLIHYQENVTHNAHIGFGVRLKEMAILEVALRVGSRVRFDVSEDEAYFWHLPVYIKAGPIWSFRKTEVGLAAAFVLDIARIKSNVPDVEDTANRVHPGLGAYPRVAFHALENLSFFLDMGADIFFKTYYYTWKGEVVVKYHSVQPSIVLGCEWISGRRGQ